ncbi:MAG: 3-dehydroquinate synthase [Gammaproteobacteria bacterium]|nr:3-dehydroquinate synthase [Gammaproteobacteria bacterium]MBU1777504.1 3-dehydroquinate synthase [Gammaproteobacteria bacterium]MBU1968041.1 3-dehydroquinate synthase [Gammaproteobacteria bacterium]
MGAGKTTVGKLLAKHLGKTFIDSDEEIQRRTGVTIPHIFDVEGEAGFRMRETGVIQELLMRDGIVLATGGGAVLNPQNRTTMKQNGIVVYLKSNVHDLWQRTRHDHNRPLLQTENPRARLQELHDQRDPLYMETADLIVNTGKQSVQILLEKLQHQLEDIKPKNTTMDSMQTLNVGLAERSYPIHIGSGLLERIDLLLPHIPRKRTVIVSNTTVAPLYLQRLSDGLMANGVQVQSVILPDGEQYKSGESLNTIYDALLTARSERSTPLIALGGGVIGDITGYAAATYLRGVPFIQIPTTLLSQVDSSVGGKTGINHPLGKNMIGAFYQPRVVLADTTVLDTLPDKELRAGIAEVIKYGLIRDLPFLEWLEANMSKLLARDTEALQYAIARSCQNKAEVVGSDERESGERALLNLGHTFGHAIENGMGYGVWLHGEAVAAGTIMAADLSQRLGWLSAQDVARVRKLFEQSGLPVISPKLGTGKYLVLMGLDKKVADGKIRFVLLKSLGQAVMTGDVPQALLEQTLEACSA